MAASTIDVTISLLNVNPNIKEYVKIIKEKNKRNCIIQPKGRIPQLYLETDS